MNKNELIAFDIKIASAVFYLNNKNKSNLKIVFSSICKSEFHQNSKFKMSDFYKTISFPISKK